eukprot:9503725-Pyramimonas_sp.AAC.1
MDPPALVTLQTAGYLLRKDNVSVAQAIFLKAEELQAALFAGQGQQPQYQPQGCCGKHTSVAEIPLIDPL